MQARGGYRALLRLIDTRAAGDGFPDMLDAENPNEERLAEFGLTAPTPAELAELRRLRDGLLFIVLNSVPDLPARVRALNSLVRDYELVPQLDGALDLGWAAAGESRVARLAERVLPQALHLLRTGELARMQLCSAEDCAAPFVASSTRRSYCSARCATRVRVRRHRKAATHGAEPVE